MEWVEFSAKTVDEALDLALQKLETTSDKVEYEIIERESSGLLGFFSKPAKIRVKLKMTLSGIAEDFLKKVCSHMGIDATFEIQCNEEENRMDINIMGNDMGLLIGRRGQTLEALQYLTNLAVNKQSDTYYRIKLDSENYRARRKATLENLAKNVSFKVKKTKQPVTLDAMTPYERRIIHSALQYDKAVETYSEGEEPNRKVIIAPKKGYRDYGNRSGNYKKYNRNYNNNYNSNRGGYSRNSFEKREEETLSEE